MGGAGSREQSLTKAIENQDATELRTILKDLTPEQIRALIKSIATIEENQCTILHYATWQGTYLEGVVVLFTLILLCR